MKQLKLITLVALLVAAVPSHAQITQERVRILPSRDKGFIRILFVGNQVSNVEVKFYNDEGLYTLDEINKKSFHKGFIKKYDISNVHEGESFRIDISAKDFFATYEMKPTGQYGYQPKLEHLEQTYPEMVARKD